jgi:cytochrome b561
MDRPTTLRFSFLGQALHWCTAIAVLAAFVLGPGGSESRVYAAARDADRQWHETLGLLVLALVVLRVVWRLGAKVPEPPAGAPWMTVAAKFVQVALYALLFAVPLTAIAGAWLEGHPLTLLAGIRIGPLLAESRPAGPTIAEIHTWLGDAIVWLAGLHALAGLYHHVVLKDGVLASMVPRGWLRDR